MTTQADTMEKIVALCRRRGFIFGSSEIYGGIGGFWDYGPLGAELKRNIKDAWWNDMVRNPPPGPNGVEYQMVGVDCSIIMNPKVWEASGHVGGFNDPMRDCRECKLRYRGDFLGRMFMFAVDQIPASSTIHDALSGLEGKEAELSLIVDGSPGSSCEDYAPAIKRAMGAKKVKLVTVPRTDAPFALMYWIVDGKKYFMPESFEGKSAKDLDCCPNCGGELTEERAFNLMLETHIGALQDAASVAYLRPETAQGIFANFKNVVDSSRVKVPFGIAQVGKSFRNEINPRNYTFRSREFEQYEIEFFCHPSEAAMWYEYWRDLRHKWYVGLGLKSDKLRLRDHEGDELAHY
ncbi:MAG: glycine--tRNA ligase, partial [Phycisphaerae bacterium]